MSHATGPSRSARRRRGAPLVACLTALLAAAACAPPAPGLTPAPAEATLPAERVLDTRHDATVSWAAMVDTLAGADVVFLGEQHDDSSTHRLELAVLEGLAARGREVTLALEMFERDVQPLLDRYLAGGASEAELRAGARPWPNYASDYRPLVEFARARGWPVVASNVPRPIASAVGRGGLAVVDTLSPARRAYVAADLSCPDDRYRSKFVAEMAGMGGHGGVDSAAASAMLQRFYQAQCVKDETMGEAVAAAVAPGRVVVHVNGAFHSDERLGTVTRLLRRRPAARALVVSFVPAPLAAGLDAAALAARGDFVVITTRAPR
ncbi:MAG: ChaN family lipoprotein [Gemmatimonadaceae bacterium]